MYVLNLIIKYCMFILCNNVISNYVFCNQWLFRLPVTMFVVTL